MGGLDSEGKGAVWGYDAVGSFERVPYVCTGTGSALVTSILDNQLCGKTQVTYCCFAAFMCWLSCLCLLLFVCLFFFLFFVLCLFVQQFTSNLAPAKSLDQALKIVKDAFISAGERDIYTGDWVDIAIVTKDGIKAERFILKKD